MLFRLFQYRGKSFRIEICVPLGLYLCSASGVRLPFQSQMCRVMCVHGCISLLLLHNLLGRNVMVMEAIFLISSVLRNIRIPKRIKT
uniref:Uncharacterized protein n=1 Tax=Arundo donax TaxID=35708 RepID=A0A0A9E5J8_ARUDO